MKQFLFLIVISLAFVNGNPSLAQLKVQCATCFTSEITKSTKVDDHCTDYELKVFYTGQCEHALSHFTVAIPGCFTLSELSNSESCQQEIGYDPTTGLTGFKIDNTSNFGETSRKYFLVSFRLCANNSNCSPCWKPVVAYKAGDCFELDSLRASCSALTAHLDKKDATCYGLANGRLSVITDSGVPPFRYSWSNGSVGSFIENVGAGSYSVTVKDATGSQLTLASVIGQPGAIVITSTVTAASCSGESNGAISLAVSGGTGAPYSYLWNSGSTSSSLSSLKSGTYSVTVKDSLGCSASGVFTVTNQKQLALTASTRLPSCTQTNGSISLSVTGGTAPYTFAWSDGNTSSAISNLAAGAYSVTVTDAEGCSANASYLLHENNTLKISYSVTPTTCLDNGSGAINIMVSGGSPPYSFSWSNGETTENLSGLTSGAYTVTVKDSLGCQISARILVFKNTFQVSSKITQPLCWGDSTGSISLTPAGKTASYQFAWTNGSTAASLTHLAPGNYSVTITDSTGCTKLMTYSIVSPTQLQATTSVTNTSCNTSSLAVTPAGGTSPYSYLWSTGAQTQNISHQPPGTYFVTITDANACFINKQIVIDNVGTLACSITPLSATPHCLSGNNKIYTALSGADSYQWRIDSADSSWHVQSGSTSDTLIYMAGNQNTSATFTLTISKNGCTQTCSYTASTCTTNSGNGGNNNESCSDCFKSSISKISGNESCVSYEVNVTTDGNCKYDLSHFVIAIPCGELSDYSDSGHWPLVVGKDPTTGLTGLKVDNVNNFGNAISSFVLKFTICYTSASAEQLKDWNPGVVYKAGQCIAYDTLRIDGTATCLPYPNPFRDSFSIDVSCDKDETITVELYDQYGKTACEPFRCSVSAGDKRRIQIDGSFLAQNIYLYRVRSSSKIVNGRIMKKN